MNRKVLFLHDGPIFKLGSKYYGNQLNNELVERYKTFGSKITFLMRSKILPVAKVLEYSEINHKDFNFIEVPNFKSIKHYYRKIRATKIIREAIDKNDIIILRLPSAVGTIAFDYAKRNGKPILIEMVACVYDALWNYDWRGKLIAKSKMLNSQRILSESSHVIYVTEKFLQNRYPTNGKSIACSDVIINNIDESILYKRIAKIQNCDIERLILGTVAAIDVPYKGQKDVISSLKLLKEKGTNFKYKIVGQGDPSKLKQDIADMDLQDQVEILGSLPHEAVFNFLDEIDVYIQPSKQEGLPRAVVEAMSRACPVVGSNLAGIPELVSKDALFTPGNISELSELLSSLNKPKLKKWSQENFDNSKKFQTNILNEKRIKFYNEFSKDYNLLN